MSLSAILTILKYVGTAIAGIAGIWGTASETRDKTTGRLSAWGKWALGLAIAGFIVAIGSQIAEQIKANADKIEAQKEKAAENQRALATENRLKEQLTLTQTQLTIATQQLVVAQQIASQVQSSRAPLRFIELDVEIEMPKDDQRVQNLIREISAWVNNNGTTDNLPYGFRKWNRIVVIRPDQIEVGLFPSRSELTLLLVSLSQIQLSMLLIKQRSIDEPTPSITSSLRRSGDIYASDVNQTNRQITLVYDPDAPDRLLVKLTRFQFSSTEWTSNGKIVGINDLSGAAFKLFFSTPIRGDAQLGHVKLSVSTVAFDKHLCTLESFITSQRPSASRSGSTVIFETTLPNANTILTEAAYKPRPF